MSLTHEWEARDKGRACQTLNGVLWSQVFMGSVAENRLQEILAPHNVTPGKSMLTRAINRNRRVGGNPLRRLVTLRSRLTVTAIKAHLITWQPKGGRCQAVTMVICTWQRKALTASVSNLTRSRHDKPLQS